MPDCLNTDAQKPNLLWSLGFGLWASVIGPCTLGLIPKSIGLQCIFGVYSITIRIPLSLIISRILDTFDKNPFPD